jgi:adenylate cyclase
LWGTLYLIQRQHEKAIAAGQKSIELDPNNTEGYALLAQTIYYSGRSDEAITLIQQAMRLSPYPPAYYLIILGMAYQGAGRYQEAHPVLQKLLDRAQKGEFSPLFANNMLTINYALMGNYKKAREHWAEVLKIYPKASLEWIRGLSFFKDPDQLESLLDAYRAAGISAHPPLPLPDRPSIAVLPFVNMSDDPKQEYLSDGITEQIITSISKIPRLFVISRTSSFKYKGKAVDIKRVGRELGVKYVLEGSVQRSGDRLRITAQLIDALTGKHLWAERYDRDFKDLFALQDEITLKIIQSLSVKLTEGDRARLQSGGTYNLKAVEKIFEAVKYARAFNRESNATARKLYEETIALDPEFAGAYTGLAMTHFMDVQLRASKSPRESYAKATKLLKKAIALDENFGLPHSHLCAIYGMQRQYEKAIAEGEKAVALNPNSDRALEWLGLAMDWVGRPEEAIALYEKAMRLCPFPPSYYYLNLGHAYRSMERYKEAITEYKKALHLTPNNVLAFAGLAICYSSLGQEEEARAAAAELLKINPKFFFKGYVKRLPYKNQALKERWRDALQKAGLK